MMSRSSHDVMVMVGGKPIGHMQTINASNIKVDREKMIQETDQALGRLLLDREREVTLSLTEPVLSPRGFVGLMGVMNPKFDVKTTHSVLTGKLPNGRTRLPKRGRLRKKWQKKYYSNRETIYRDCTIESDGADATGGTTFVNLP